MPPPTTIPLASFENTRFRGNRPRVTGHVGARTQLFSRETEAGVIRELKAREGAHLSDMGPDQNVLQPRGGLPNGVGTGGPMLRSSFHGVIPLEDAIITQKWANTPFVEQNEVQNEAGSNP